MKHSIYVLIDPRNEKPFYVGATIRPLKDRLREHISSQSRLRVLLLREIMKAGLKPEIRTLKTSSTKTVDYWERFYYEKLLKEGNILYQHPSFFKSSGLNGKNDGIWRFPLKLDPELEGPLRESALRNNRTINEEINVAVEIHVKKVK